MIWWAYAGLSGSIVLSLVALALTMGVPSDAIMALAIAASGMMAGGGVLAGLLVMALGRRSPVKAAPIEVHAASVRARGEPPLPAATLRISPSTKAVVSIAALRPIDVEPAKHSAVAPS